MLLALIQNVPSGLRCACHAIDIMGILSFTTGKIVIFRSLLIFIINSNISNINSITLRTSNYAKNRDYQQRWIQYGPAQAKGFYFFLRLKPSVCNFLCFYCYFGKIQELYMLRGCYNLLSRLQSVQIFYTFNGSYPSCCLEGCGGI